MQSFQMTFIQRRPAIPPGDQARLSSTGVSLSSRHRSPKSTRQPSDWTLRQRGKGLQLSSHRQVLLARTIPGQVTRHGLVDRRRGEIRAYPIAHIGVSPQPLASRRGFPARSADQGLRSTIGRLPLPQD